MKVKLKILECANLSFLMIYLLVFLILSVACSGAEFKLHYISYLGCI